jgi:hypothetical protein
MTSPSAQRIAQALAAGCDVDSRPQPLPAAHAKCADGVIAFGRGQPALELAILPMKAPLTSAEARDVWAARQAGRPNPLVLLLVTGLDEDSSSLWVGVDPASLAVVELDWRQALTLACAALKEPNGPAAVRYLEHSVPRPGEDAIPGLNNLGMFARHTLTELAPGYPEWADSARQGAELAGLRGRELLEALGFQIEAQQGSAVELLRDRTDRAAAVAVFLDQGETADSPLPRLAGETPVSAALARAERENLRFVFIAKSDKLRLHVTGSLHGVGRKGPAETLVEVDMPLLHRDQVAYVPLIFSAKAITDGGTFERILSESRDYSVKLSERLRDRIYVDVVPSLAVSVAQANPEDALDDVYEQSLVLLFRLLFVAYAEDRDLLPYRRNDRYRNASLKALARELADLVEEARDHNGDQTTSLWSRVNALFEAVDKGAPTWDVPAYNGGLFSADGAVNEAGASLGAVELTNEQLGQALTALLVEPGSGELPAAPVDFRSLSVRDFGTIYEGLLESGISEAPEDLALDNAGNYVPANGRTPVVRAGDIYHHNRGGARKSTGSYFTKDFAVEHLLNKALVPSVDAHLARVAHLVEDGDDEAATAAFFDFRCADIAMGSGHFLVAAVDKIEERFSRFLDEHPIKGVVSELDSLRAAAMRGLGESADLYEIERRALLRRQIARRCVYGVDVNRIAVELAQLGLWVHTFVPGLALTYLGHNLVWGNGLTGIGTLEEAAAALDRDSDGGTMSIFLDPIRTLLAETTKPLERLAKANDATRDDMQVVYDAQREAEAAAAPACSLFDLICAQRRGETDGVEMAITAEALEQHPGLESARDASRELQALHFPVAFPEVFLREPPGFDCMLGNPPWEEATVEKLGFWAQRFPGLRSLGQAAQRAQAATLETERPDLVEAYELALAEAEHMRIALGAGPFPGMGTGDPDLYKAFSWRFWGLMRDGGKAGVVLPRSALFAAGSAEWREAIFDRRGWEHITTTLNRGGWMFDDAEPRYTVGLVVLGKDAERDEITLVGPFTSLADMQAKVESAARSFPLSAVRSWVPGAGLPLLPSSDSADVFERYVAHPRLGDAGRPDGWRVRPATDFHATNDKKFMLISDERPTDAAWPVYGGRSFYLWNPDTELRYAWADPDVATNELLRRRTSSSRNRRSPFSEMPPDWLDDPKTLPCLNPRIAFRDITRGTDSRTMIVSLIPPEVVLTNKAPYFLWPRGSENDHAYVLGVLASIPLDWYARRVIELGMNFHALNGMPVPAAGRDDIRRRAVESLAASLSRRDEKLAGWAPEVAACDVSDEEDALARLDALAASLYGLDRTHVIHVFQTFHEGWNSQERLDRVLAHFDAL